ncbi:MAG: hypothetical protein ACRBBW_00760 [Cellvibrionaceae bacterium]
MIVFTATNKETRDVYVGTARESVEEEWADLNAQAENGVAGQFFQQLRQQGAAGFEVDTWAYGESPSEARESMREARDELGAQPIKSSRSKVSARKAVNEHSDSMKALMAVFQEAMTDGDSSDLDEPFDAVVSEKNQNSSDQSTALAESAQKAPDAAPGANAQPEAISEDERMKSRVEAMKAAQAKLLRERAQQSKVAPKKTAKASTDATSTKIASGRTGSSAKEKRIREAIEAERERRENMRQSRGRDEYDEMSAVMARIEMRRLATKRSKAEKTKAEAAKKRKLEREKKAQEAAAAASALTVSIKASNDASSGTDKNSPVNADSAALIAKALGGDSAPAKKAKAVSPAEATKASRAAAKAKVAELKLAVGRTGSSAKEKRIKEAIEQEKADRQSKNSAQSAAEAEEMAAILARLDERGKMAEKFKRSR